MLDQRPAFTISNLNQGCDILIYAIIQARMNSARLPGKVLMDLAGKSVLARVVERLKEVSQIDKIIIATTRRKEDDLIVEECVANNAYYFRGPENNVLGRYYHCADYFGIKKGDGIIRITADCPLIDPEVVNYLIELWKKNKDKYVSNVVPPDETGKRFSSYPDGLDCEMFSFELLKKAWESAKTEYEAEHVTPWMVENTKHAILKYSEDLSHINLALDTADDYKKILSIYKKLGDKKFYLKDILKCL